MRFYFLLLFVLVSAQFKLYAAKVDTVAVFSESMNKDIKVVVITPDNAKGEIVPTLYLLHGYGGNYATWIRSASHIQMLADRYNYMIVCPDGGFSSWYWDVEGDSNYKYETFVSSELVKYVEGKYNVCKDRHGRGITGFSMGGHGAMYLAIRHQDVFGAVGTTAGGMDIRPFPNNWDMAKRLGSYAKNKEKWDSHTVIEMLHLVQPNSLKIFIDCGYDDFFYNVNEAIHDKMRYMDISHTFLAMPGKHNWDYWRESIHFQMAFFDEYFRNK